MTAIDWPGLMRAGLHGLRLTSREFWALTPAELQLMLGATHAAAPMDREKLNAMLRAFPDNAKDMSNG